MNFNVIGIGEVLWDLLPLGARMGGAPANFAYHASALGAHAGVITRVGPDKLGQDIRKRMEEMDIQSNLVQVDEFTPTGTVTVHLNENGIPQFVIHKHVAWDRLSLTEIARNAINKADAIYFGSLAQRSGTSRNTIRELLRHAHPTSLKAFDINLRQHFYNREIIEQSLNFANILKLNDAELTVLAAMFKLAGGKESQIVKLAKYFELSTVALTFGTQGSLLYQDGRWSRCEARPICVKDTVGAGDTFTAALVMGLLRKVDLDQINFFANEIAQYVCTCSGATPPLPNELRTLIADNQHPITIPGSGSSPIEDLRDCHQLHRCSQILSGDRG